MIAVNVGRSWSAFLSYEEQDKAISGDWPTRKGVTRTDIEAAGDILVAVRRSRVVAVRAIKNIQDADGGRLKFRLGLADERWQTLLNMTAPDILRWRRGESWPIRVVNTEDVVEALLIGDEARNTADDEAARRANPSPGPVSIGGFTVTLAGRSRLVVNAPRDTTVLVIAAN